MCVKDWSNVTFAICWYKKSEKIIKKTDVSKLKLEANGFYSNCDWNRLKTDYNSAILSIFNQKIIDSNQTFWSFFLHGESSAIAHQDIMMQYPKNT
jgi:hypothetical protein